MGLETNGGGGFRISHDGDPIDFDSRADLLAWTEMQDQFWEGTGTSIKSYLTKILIHVREIQALPDGRDRDLHNLVAQINTTLDSGVAPFFVPSKEAEFIKDMAKDRPDIVDNVIGQFRVDRHHIEVKMYIADFLRGTYTKKSPKYQANARLLNTLIKQHKEALKAFETQGEAALKHSNDEVKRTRRAAIKTGIQKIRGARSDIDERLKTMTEAEEKIRLTEQTYGELMNLQAPFDYWTTKAAKHRDTESDALDHLLFFAICATTALALYFVALIAFTAFYAKPDMPPYTIFLITGLTFLLSTSGIWAARILTRIFLSEKHLRMDAEERAVMAKTYLALTNTNDATDDDRKIILSSLFRPTEDGIVKDDASPLFDISKLRPPGS